ncbi:MOSC domain-containing protein [Fibrella forsythiae]|uniref:MOSC domain-containing protein n=1 Tax=Fibrella forsythiae TaxID=2817061 RepID=A0ABS3JCY2_9BACT|nr:MOSC domain-containing protein [Fibrella forsythiae]MBO0947850.1 MOSC domain-containing protein [Fibrella forsythiae]
MPANIKELFTTVAHPGRVDWISIRPQRNIPVTPVTEVTVSEQQGLVGDHYSGQNGKRHITLIQAEHLPAIAAFVGEPAIDPALLRRNIVVSGLNLLALKGQQFRLGEDVILEYTGECYPCSKMETALGEGGYNALRGHGGITARVIQGGQVRVGDQVRLV